MEEIGIGKQHADYFLFKCTHCTQKPNWVWRLGAGNHLASKKVILVTFCTVLVQFIIFLLTSISTNNTTTISQNNSFLDWQTFNNFFSPSYLKLKGVVTVLLFLIFWFLRSMSDVFSPLHRSGPTLQSQIIWLGPSKAVFYLIITSVPAAPIWTKLFVLTC